MSYSPRKWIHPRRWQHEPLLLRQPCRRDVRSWLAEPGSLTARLATLATQLNGELHVDVLSEGWGLPSAEEAHMLGLRRGEFAWIREVILVGLNTPWVQARSVLPRRSLGGLNRRLTRLGNQSLGSLLFRDPALQRGPIRYAQLALASDTVWARRSRFLLRGQAILVAEAFLPALLTASAQADTIAP
ncbi:MAG: chorismate lyase [Paraperlucidibaca sp.]